MLKLRPVYKTFLWGGTKLHDLLHKDTEGLESVAESWELSTHPNGESTIVGGLYDGKTLNEYFDEVGWERAGDYACRNHRLPIMIKYIDAHENLSVQVHPTAEYAKAHGTEEGKNEIWYMLDADENAFLYLGFRRDVEREEVLAAIENGTIEQLLNRIPAKKGEFYFVPAGTVHAIGAGCLICELQQTSDATYRLYDYGRADKNGVPRPLHIKDGLGVLDLKKFTYSREGLSASVRGMLGGEGSLFFSEYNAEGEALYFSPDLALLAVLVTEGSGCAECGGAAPVPVRQGDALLFLKTETPVKLSGKCRALIVGY